ncbi:MAG: hypothetical protein ACOYVK_04215 [Bacillota bacterium]
MRITQSQIKIASNTEGENPGLKVGQIIKGAIEKIDGDTILLKLLGGEVIQAKTSIPLEDQLNQSLRFIVKQSENNLIVLKPLDDSSNGNSLQTVSPSDVLSKVSSLLAKEGIPVDQEILQLIKELYKYDLPINSHTIMDFIKLKSYYEKTASILEQQPTLLQPSMLDKNIHDVIKEFMLKLDNSVPKSPQSTTADETVQPKGNIISDNNTARPPIVLDNETMKVEKTAVSSKLLFKPNDLNIQGMNYEKLLFLIKNNFQTNISNAVHVNNLIYHDFMLSQQLTNFIDKLSLHAETKDIGELFKNIFEKITKKIVDKNFNPKEIIDELRSNLESAQKTIETLNRSDKHVILKDIQNMKDSIDFLNKLNQTQTYIQLPIKLDHEYKNLELFICDQDKKKRKIDPHDIRLFISLDTNTLDTVQALIEIKHKNLTCNFRFASEAIKSYFIEHESNLKNGLDSFGFDNTNFHYAVFNRKNTLMSIPEESLSDKAIHSIDLKV